MQCLRLEKTLPALYENATVFVFVEGAIMGDEGTFEGDEPLDWSQFEIGQGSNASATVNTIQNIDDVFQTEIFPEHMTLETCVQNDNNCSYMDINDTILPWDFYCNVLII